MLKILANTKLKFQIIIAAMLVALFPSMLHADRIHLKDGSNYSGKVIDQNDEFVKFEDENHIVTIPRERVEWVIEATEEEIRRKRLAAGHFDKAQAWFSKREFRKAIVEYERAQAFEPKNVDILNNLGAAYASAGREDRAAEIFQQVLAASPDHETARSNLAKVLRGMGVEATELAGKK